jgi:hypothetical protein
VRYLWRREVDVSDLNATERRVLERRLGMGSGYVLDFSNRTFKEFVVDTIGLDPYDANYGQFGDSKANRLRGLWEKAPNHLVGKLLIEVLGLCRDSDPDHEHAVRIATRLMQSAPVDLTGLQTKDGGREFEILVREVEAAIGRNQPEAGLDRLHTYAVRFFRGLAASRGIETDRDKPLHSIVGEYIKALRAEGAIESDMTDRILKSTISVLEAFNKIRNEQSLAHDNKPLGYDESNLVLSHVCGVIRFVRAIEDRRKLKSAPAPADAPDEEVPF